MSQPPPSLAQEQREASRFRREPDTDFAAIWFPPGYETLCEVHDESLTGIGLLIEDLQDLELGSDVEIVYAGSFLQSRIVHIEPQADGRHLVGFSCERA